MFLTKPKTTLNCCLCLRITLTTLAQSTLAISFGLLSVSCAESSFSSRADKETISINRPSGRSLSHDGLFRAIALVESNANDSAVGDNGASIGRYQIGNAYWTDALQQNPSIGGLYADVTSPLYAEKVIEAYMRRYLGDAIWENLTPDNVILIARTHNGGWRGGSKPHTLGYGCRVLALSLLD